MEDGGDVSFTYAHDIVLVEEAEDDLAADSSAPDIDLVRLGSSRISVSTSDCSSGDNDWYTTSTPSRLLYRVRCRGPKSDFTIAGTRSFLVNLQPSN